ncbi:hypothetical protein ACC703_03890 [Rhizobium ruizarguesonis]
MPKTTNVAEHPAASSPTLEDAMTLDRLLQDRLQGTSMENVTPAARVRLAFDLLQLIRGLAS